MCLLITFSMFSQKNQNNHSRMPSSFSKFQYLDLRVTRNGVYPKYYIFSETGNPPKLYKMKDLSEGVVKRSLFPLMAPALHPHGAVALPVEQKFESIVLDIKEVKHCYPGYADLIMRKIENGECAVVEGGSVWFSFLYDVCDHHVHVLSRRCKPRYGRPSWNWEIIHTTIVGDVEEVFEHWFDNVCKPHMEDRAKGGRTRRAFFLALEHMLGMVEKACSEKWDLVEEAWVSRTLPDCRREEAALEALARDQERSRNTGMCLEEG